MFKISSQISHFVFRFAQIILFVILLQACVPNLPQTTKKMPSEKLAIPESFPAQQKNEDDSDKNKTDQTQSNADKPSEKKDVVTKNWQLFFEDKQLASLIEIALTNNQDLNILEQQINIANNEVMARQGQYIPKLGIGAGYESEKNSKFTSAGAGDATANLPDRLNNRQLGFMASWEVDIWGKLRNSAKSAYYEYLASIEGRNFAVTQLVAEVASDYYELMALDNELALLKKYIQTLQDAEQMAELQRVAARTTSLAVKRFDAEISKSKSRKFTIQQQIVVTENHLNKILGRLPQKIDRPSAKFQEIPVWGLADSIPSALLDNRPDVRQAALKLEAAKLEVKSVKAQFYPSLNIDANLGYQSFNAHHFIASPSALAYNVAGGITAPLLNRNAIKADYFSANNKQIEAIYDYEKSFISAFAEVSNQLAAVNNLKQAYSAKEKQTEKLAESFEISNLLFRAARVTYLESLLTRRDYLESQMELVEVKQRQLVAYVNLYKALGGGWRS